MSLGLELASGRGPARPPAAGARRLLSEVLPPSSLSAHPAVPACVVGGSEFVLILQAAGQTEMVPHAAAAAARSSEDL